MELEYLPSDKPLDDLAGECVVLWRRPTAAETPSRAPPPSPAGSRDHEAYAKRHAEAGHRRRRRDRTSRPPSPGRRRRRLTGARAEPAHATLRRRAPPGARAATRG